jgi:beta-glucosidase
MRRRFVGLGLASICVWFACGDDDAPRDSGLEDGSSDASDAARDYVPEPFAPTEATRAYCPRPTEEADAIEARITELLAQMTPREKIACLHGASLAMIEGTWRVAGVERLGIPGLRMLDGPRGLSSMTGKNGTAFPVAMMRGATFDPELERRVGASMARELKSVGADVLLAPTINVLRHPRWGRAQETYSEDPHHMAEMALAFVQGVQSEGVLASAKHFAANSIEDTRHEVDVRLDERTLREVYLPAFRRVVVEGRVASVMTAYNQLNGRWADQQDHLLRTILKGEWAFAGFVESDWILGTHGDVESLRAGLDVEMPAPTNFRRLASALDAGEIEEREIDASVRRVLRAQLCYGLDARVRPIDDVAARETEAHLALAREVAERGVVLLKNDAALPIDRASVSRIAVLGRVLTLDNVGDTGSSNVRASDVVSALEGIRELAGEVAIDVVEVLDDDGEATVRAADAVVIVTGLTHEDEGEATIGAGDRESLALPAEELATIRAVAAIHPRVIVVLEGGASILVRDFADEIEGLLFAFYPGSEGGRALARVLFGDVVPRGRLPFSIPRVGRTFPSSTTSRPPSPTTASTATRTSRARASRRSIRSARASATRASSSGRRCPPRPRSPRTERSSFACRYATSASARDARWCSSTCARRETTWPTSCARSRRSSWLRARAARWCCGCARPNSPRGMGARRPCAGARTRCGWEPTRRTRRGRESSWCGERAR